MKQNVYTPLIQHSDEVFSRETPHTNVFLGGTIENGDSFEWQQALIDTLDWIEFKHQVNIFNPRRDNWPSSDEHNEIDKQINWELEHLERADIIVMNILEDSKSPISLMEIGLFARTGKLIVFCPEEFYRYDNVRKVCERYDIKLYNTNDVAFIADKLTKMIGVDNDAMDNKRV